MYLSFLLVNVGDNPDRPRPGRLWLRNAYHVHQRLCMAFPSQARKNDDVYFLKPFRPDDFSNNKIKEICSKSDDNKHVHSERGPDSGFLYRIDSLAGNKVVILVQSSIKPDWDYAFCNAVYLLAAPPEIRQYSPAFRKGQILRFRLAANPTKKIMTKSGSDGKKNNGKRITVKNDELFGWLERKADAAGFSVESNSANIRTGYIYVNNKNSGEKYHLRSALYEGNMIVTDPDRFQQTLACGIGPGKAFGFGLLSVIPIEYRHWRR
jgi:CRISPR system Cascade subunit CasE